MGGSSGDGGPATSAELRSPSGVAVNAAGNVLIADKNNNRVRVVATSTGTFYGQPMTAGHIYTIAGTGTQGFAGDGGSATKAELGRPQSVAVDAAGNVLIADSFNYRVRVVAARTGTFYGIAMTAGNIYTIAGTGTFGFSGDGGPATSAELKNPAGVGADSSGNVVIADTNNNRVRVVATSSGTFYGQPMTAGDIYTMRHRPARAVGRRRPRHQRRTHGTQRAVDGRRREPADRRQLQLPGPGGGGSQRHLLRHCHDRRAHLHHRRHRHVRVLRRRRPRHQRRNSGRFRGGGERAPGTC